MANTTDLRDPWLVAVWPGMGSVAWLAGGYLIRQLGAARVAQLNARDYFEPQAVEVAHGLATPGRLPHNLFFQYQDPRGKRDLLIFIGEAQPATGGYQLCQKVLDYAIQRGVRRFFTFAAMATQLHPGTTPRVFAVATDVPSLRQVGELGTQVLESGQIGGLNGLLLTAGAQRGLGGTCLLGELPFFAVGVPNPRAAQVVLQKFTELAGLEVDFTELASQARSVDRQLLHLLEMMQREANESAEESEEEEPEELGPPLPEEPAAPAPTSQPPMDPGTRHRIEALFQRAQHDRSKAFELKQELDRLGVFKQYEDRFLDLFRKAE